MLNKILKFNYKFMKTIAPSKGTVSNKLVCSDKTVKMDSDKIKKRDEIFQKFWDTQ